MATPCAIPLSDHRRLQSLDGVNVCSDRPQPLSDVFTCPTHQQQPRECDDDETNESACIRAGLVHMLRSESVDLCSHLFLIFVHLTACVPPVIGVILLPAAAWLLWQSVRVGVIEAHRHTITHTPITSVALTPSAVRFDPSPLNQQELAGQRCRLFERQRASAPSVASPR